MGPRRAAASQSRDRGDGQQRGRRPGDRAGAGRTSEAVTHSLHAREDRHTVGHAGHVADRRFTPAWTPGKADRAGGGAGAGVSTVLHVPIERREFLFLAGAAATGAGLAGCASNGPGTTSPRPNRSESVSAVPSPTVSPPGDVTMQLGPQVVHGPRKRAQVALTFHGQGPVPMADALLHEAERAEARVTVLAVGAWLGQYPPMAPPILRAGRDVANRTRQHLDIAAMAAQGAHAEIADCARRLRALTGSIGRWFRPSQTHYATPLIERTARKVGYPTCVSYDVDSLDYTDPAPHAPLATL